MREGSAYTTSWSSFPSDHILVEIFWRLQDTKLRSFVSIRVYQGTLVAAFCTILPVVLIAFFVVAHPVVHLLQLAALLLLLVGLRCYGGSLKRLGLDGGHHLLDVVVVVGGVGRSSGGSRFLRRRHRVWEARGCRLRSRGCAERFFFTRGAAIVC